MTSKWNIVKQLVLQRNTADSFSQLNFENSDPELCLTLFNNTLNFTSLKNRIQTADKKWISEFLERGGLETVLNLYADAANQPRNHLKCIRCIKAIMNHPFGMEYIVVVGGNEGANFVDIVIEGNMHIYVLHKMVNCIMIICRPCKGLKGCGMARTKGVDGKHLLIS